MKKFKITYDEKATIWLRTEGEIEAETLEEAQRLFKTQVEDTDLTWTLMEDTIELIDRKENYAAGICNQLLPDDNELIPDNFQVKEFVEELNYEIENGTT